MKSKYKRISELEMNLTNTPRPVHFINNRLFIFSIAVSQAYFNTIMINKM